MPGNAIVVKGGRLIDGTGRQPIDNSVIVIEADRFKVGYDPTVAKSRERVLTLDRRSGDSR